MGVDRTSGSADESEDIHQPDGSVHRSPPDRPEDRSHPKAGRAMTEASQKPVESGPAQPAEGSGDMDGPKPNRDGADESRESQRGGNEPGASTVGAETGRDDSAEGESSDGYVSPLERMPSYGGFATLDEEFAARAKSREIARQHNNALDENNAGPASGRESPPPKLDYKWIRDQIDPLAPDLGKVERHKEPLQRAVRDKDTEWTEGVNRLDELPTGEKLAEPDEDKRSRREKLRDKLFEHGEDLLDETQKDVDKIAGLFDRPHPTGSHAVTRSNQPIIESSHHGVDAGEVVTAAIAGAVVAGKLYQWGRERIVRKVVDDDGNG